MRTSLPSCGRRSSSRHGRPLEDVRQLVPTIVLRRAAGARQDEPEREHEQRCPPTKPRFPLFRVDSQKTSFHSPSGRDVQAEDVRSDDAHARAHRRGASSRPGRADTSYLEDFGHDEADILRALKAILGQAPSRPSSGRPRVESRPRRRRSTRPTARGWKSSWRSCASGPSRSPRSARRRRSSATPRAGSCSPASASSACSTRARPSSS